ncbi:MAG TPA: M12 family metallopeptidase [Xanthobacteraceae bacterium]|nr:M12 family metallopeptidase [Xanthobacteraceae bacterium]
MTSTEVLLRDALTTIADLANTAVGADHNHGPAPAGASQDYITCTPKTLPTRLLVKAAKTAVKINPVNGPVFGPVATIGAADAIMEPQAIAVLVSKYWGTSPRTLTVSFMESTPADLRAHIVSHMNAWTRTACISFAETSGTGDVRISREPGGYWSYLGTDINHIPKNRQTMNLQGFTMNTPESEYRRVVRHETGHTLGFPHEHMRKALVARIDPQKAYAYFLRTQDWSEKVVDQQVLTSLDEASLMGTPVDQTSIMCYQLPGSITRDGQPIIGGLDINQTDYGFAGKIYPKVARGVSQTQDGDWDESEDVDPDV